ncbi:hypothetical protein GOBAR_DD27491 [Gossypium barbadense]|nr:hypothetical protein GOBAR_DD27491 [Gossypium barbadense]
MAPGKELVAKQYDVLNLESLNCMSILPQVARIVGPIASYRSVNGSAVASYLPLISSDGFRGGWAPAILTNGIRPSVPKLGLITCG